MPLNAGNFDILLNRLSNVALYKPHFLNVHFSGNLQHLPRLFTVFCRLPYCCSRLVWLTETDWNSLLDCFSSRSFLPKISWQVIHNLFSDITAKRQIYPPTNWNVFSFAAVNTNFGSRYWISHHGRCRQRASRWVAEITAKISNCTPTGCCYI